MPKLSKEYLAKFKPEVASRKILKELIKCKIDVRYCIETYFTVLAGNKRIAFKLFPHQVEMLHDYMNYTNCISLKTRQMGFTTFTAAYLAHLCIFENNNKCLIISKSKSDSKEFLKLIKDTLYEARLDYPWLVPDYQKGYDNKESFMLTTGSSVKAESAGEDAGRGTPGLKTLVIDEAAFIDRRSPGKMKEIWAAVSPALASTQGKTICISTPKGLTGWYYETYTNARSLGFHIIDAHWLKHPIYSKGAYQWIIDPNNPDGGFIKWYNEIWPEKIFDKDTGNFIEIDKASYPFIMDGKLRSPWYDNESKKLGPRLTKCELDCSFAGTGGEVIDSDQIRELKAYADTCTFTNPYSQLKGIYLNYKEYKEYNPAHKYAIAADVATGDGNDFSTFVVYDLTTREIVATYKAQLLPETFALILIEIGKRYGTCHLIVENAGGGGTTLQEIKRQGYSNLYYSTLNKKDPSTGMRKRKIGLWVSEDVRWQGGDKLESLIRLNTLKIPCLDIIEELYTWIWAKDGKRRHAPEKNDDLLMALQHVVWYEYFVYVRGQRNKNNFKQLFEVQRGTEKFNLTDEPHARGSMVYHSEVYAPNVVGKKFISGDIDSMIDRRVLTDAEADKVDNNKTPGRKIFI